MTQTEILEELADILGAPPHSLTPETSLDADGIRWDSMALLAYLAFARFQFGKTISGISCATFKTVADLIAAL